MANLSWVDELKKAGKGFRPGMEIKYTSASAGVGKTIVFDSIDIESDDFKPWRATFLPHYAEYTNYDTGEKYWKKFSREPKLADRYRANTVIRKNEDGTYEYIKNRATDGIRQLTEEEVMWLILKAG
jgi:hypothetical protein